MFLGIEETGENDETEYDEKDVEVNMEGELLSALSELRKYKFRYRELKSLIVEHKMKYEQQIEEMSKVINTLEEQIREAGRAEESLKKTLDEKQKTCDKLEADLAFLLKKIETKNVQEQYVNNSILLDKILNEQRDPNDKRG